MIDKFTPSPSQLDRLTPEEYKSFSEITIARLAEIDAIAQIPEDITEDEASARLDIERQKTEAALQPEIEVLLEGKSSIEEFERRASELTASLMLLALLLSAGGLPRLQRRTEARDIILQNRDAIRGALKAIKGTADRIAKGELTPDQIRYQARRRSQFGRSAFEIGRHINRLVSQFHNEGKRFLTSPHPCPDCPLHERRDWVPIEDIIPVSTFCVCQSNCKCRIVTRFNPSRAVSDLLGGNLLNRVERVRNAQSQAEQDYLRRHGWD